MKEHKLRVASDITETSLADAWDMLPAAKMYRIVVHPAELKYVNSMLAKWDHPLAPGIEIFSDCIMDRGAWRLEGGGETVWVDAI